jgi:diacylglycerol kinase (ATP)
MQATLIYNGNAGHNHEVSAEDLQDGLRDAGYEPFYKATDCIEDLNPILANAKGLVVSAGGDGTTREIMIRLLGRDDVYFTPLPMGTANNVCRTLGINGKPLEIVQKLGAPRTAKFDIGHLRGPWGQDYFLESAGQGFFAEILARYDPEQGKSILRSAKSLIDILQDGFARETTLYLPNEEVHGDFLLVEALNTTAIGPRLKFAPDADPTDGLLNIICIRDGQQNGYLQYLSSLLAEELYNLEDVESYLVPELKISWRGFPVHVDAILHPPNFDFRDGTEDERFVLRPYPELPSEATLHIRILPQALQVWLPQIEED